jgi:CRP-like cAMP-binding protein
MSYDLGGDILAGLSALEGCDPRQLDEVAAMMAIEQAPAGRVLGREGDPGATFWLVIDGHVRVSRTSRDPAGSRVLALVGPGSLLGELAVLRGQPRTATVTAETDCVLAAGHVDALDRLLSIPVVLSRIRRLASNRLAQDLRPVRAEVGNGTRIVVRPLLPADRDTFGAEIHRLSQESLRRRFFSPGGPPQALIDYLIDIDFVDHFAWVAIEAGDSGEGLGTGRYVRAPGAPEAEMAFGTADRHQGRGIGTFLFGALGVAAVEAGITTLYAHVMEDNRAMRSVFAKVHASSHFDEPGLVYMEAEPAAAAELIPADTRRQLAAAVHDIVTAASLALTP